MKLKLISCEVFQPEFEQAVKQGKSDLSIEFLPFGLHEKPDELRTQLQERIDAVPAGVYGAILVGYCLCSRGGDRDYGPAHAAGFAEGARLHHGAAGLTAAV
jgi:hypothetical protein